MEMYRPSLEDEMESLLEYICNEVSGISKEIMEYEMVILEEYQFPGYGSRCRKSENSEKLRGPQGVP